MRLTTVHIERPEGTTIATGIAAQVDLAAPLLHDDLNHDRDALRYDVYLSWVPIVGVQRRDMLVDDATLDPLTGAGIRLRVIAVEIFDNDHVEAHCEQLVGR